MKGLYSTRLAILSEPRWLRPSDFLPSASAASSKFTGYPMIFERPVGLNFFPSFRKKGIKNFKKGRFEGKEFP